MKDEMDYLISINFRACGSSPDKMSSETLLYWNKSVSSEKALKDANEFLSYSIVRGLNRVNITRKRAPYWYDHADYTYDFMVQESETSDSDNVVIINMDNIISVNTWLHEKKD